MTKKVEVSLITGWEFEDPGTNEEILKTVKELLHERAEHLTIYDLNLERKAGK